jgi:hypothetical protein
MNRYFSVCAMPSCAFVFAASAAETVALFPFDKPVGHYPSSVSPLAGQPVQVVVKSRGADLYALQFVP